jgi:hypothetical protein
MRSEGTTFYDEVVAELLRTGVLAAGMEILVLCGGRLDTQVMQRNGFTNVTISNVDQRPDEKVLAPYRWTYQDAEQITLADNSVDFCVVHSGLHHCQSPHRGLIEMYRVARRGLLMFEPYDNLLTRLGVRLKIGQEYEHAGVFTNDGHFGGVRNSEIPNFVYRWTEREISKTISCYAPHARHRALFFHRMRVPWTQLRLRRARWFYHAVRLAQPVLKVIEVCFPRQSNTFAAVVLKPELPAALHPWLRLDGDTVRVDETWLATRYRR